MHNPICKGSISLGTGCKECSKCFEELQQIHKLPSPYPENPIHNCDGTHGGCGRCNRCLAIDQACAEKRSDDLAEMKTTQEHERRMAELANAQRIEVLKYVVVIVAVAGFFLALAIGAYTGHIK